MFDIKLFISLRCRKDGFDTFMYCNMVAIIVLANTSTMSHNYYFFLVVRIIKTNLLASLMFII